MQQSIVLTSALFAGLIASASSVSAQGGTNFVGGVYAMANGFNGNSVVAYGRNADGTLTFLEEQPTGGDGAAFDGGEGLDPLISAYALNITEDHSYVLAVEAGSNSIAALRVEPDFTLTVTSRARTGAVGPNSIAIFGDLVYVSNIDADGQFNGEPDQEGTVRGFRLSPSGDLTVIPQSDRLLGNRPSAVEFSPDGRFLAVTSINSGSSALVSGSQDELVVYRVRPDGRLSPQPTAAATSTLRDNAQGRNLPSAIGFDIVEQAGRQIVVVTEAREFQSDGTPPAFPALQTGSVSTWILNGDGTLTPLQQDILAGNDFFDGERTACWIQFSPDNDYFWVSNALDASLSSYSFSGGMATLVNLLEATGDGPQIGDPFGTTDGWIDLWASADGQFIYQLYGLDGTIGVFSVSGSSLTLVEEVSGTLPDVNTQGIVAF